MDINYETERNYQQWLEENHPEVHRERIMGEENKRDALEELARGYRRPFFDAFAEFNPSPAYIKEVIRGLNAEAYRILQEKLAAKASRDVDISLPHLNRQHDFILDRVRQLQHRLAQRERTGSWEISGDGRGLSDTDIQRAKAVPISNFIDGSIRRSGKRSYTKCPFHTEKTGSFVIYEEQNSYHCFGCSEGGDVINFVQKQQNLNFVEAVRVLLQRA